MSLDVYLLDVETCKHRVDPSGRAAMYASALVSFRNSERRLRCDIRSLEAADRARQFGDRVERCDVSSLEALITAAAVEIAVIRMGL